MTPDAHLVYARAHDSGAAAVRDACAGEDGSAEVLAAPPPPPPPPLPIGDDPLAAPPPALPPWPVEHDPSSRASVARIPSEHERRLALEFAEALAGHERVAFRVAVCLMAAMGGTVAFAAVAAAMLMLVWAGAGGLAAVACVVGVKLAERYAVRLATRRTDLITRYRLPIVGARSHGRILPHEMERAHRSDVLAAADATVHRGEGSMVQAIREESTIQAIREVDPELAAAIGALPPDRRAAFATCGVTIAEMRAAFGLPQRVERASPMRLPAPPDGTGALPASLPMCRPGSCDDCDGVRRHAADAAAGKHD